MQPRDAAARDHDRDNGRGAKAAANGSGVDLSCRIRVARMASSDLQAIFPVQDIRTVPRSGRTPGSSRSKARSRASDSPASAAIRDVTVRARLLVVSCLAAVARRYSEAGLDRLRLASDGAELIYLPGTAADARDIGPPSRR